MNAFDHQAVINDVDRRFREAPIFNYQNLEYANVGLNLFVGGYFLVAASPAAIPKAAEAFKATEGIYTKLGLANATINTSFGLYKDLTNKERKFDPQDLLFRSSIRAGTSYLSIRSFGAYLGRGGAESGVRFTLGNMNSGGLANTLSGLTGDAALSYIYGDKFEPENALFYYGSGFLATPFGQVQHLHGAANTPYF
jgi:hypothetical protein